MCATDESVRGDVFPDQVGQASWVVERAHYGITGALLRRQKEDTTSELFTYHKGYAIAGRLYA